MVDILPSLETARRSSATRETLADPPSTLSLPPSRPRLRADPDLARLIEGEIIPRLMLSHGWAGQAGARADARTAASPAAAPRVGPRTLEAFTRLALSGEAGALTAYAETLVEGGLPLESVFLDLLAPAARRLGDDWNDDLISFTEVTIGLSRLQQVVRAFGCSLPAGDAGPGAPSACFVTAPGEQHSFGLVLLEDGFRRAGWRTALDTAADADSACELVADGWFDLFGLSASSDAPTARLADAVARVRRASRNPRLFVMAGGRLFSEDPDLAAAVGVDAVAASAAEALSLAEEALKPRALA